MTSYSVLVATTASREFRALQKKEQDRIRDESSELAEDPTNSSNRLYARKLSDTNQDYFRLMAGDFRVIYYLQEEGIRVVRIAVRSDAYSWLD